MELQSNLLWDELYAISEESEERNRINSGLTDTVLERLRSRGIIITAVICDMGPEGDTFTFEYDAAPNSPAYRLWGLKIPALR
ncbi:MAG: hypothetical protein M3Q14_00435 [bacterium]|nr:hypothetical protein [bacterium]